MKKVLESVSPHSAGKLAAVMYGIMSLLLVPVGVFMLLHGGKDRAAGLVMIVAPIIYAPMGYVVTAFTCWLYNIMARHIGGLEVTFRDAHGG
jgi:hypothetical protein